MIKLGIVQCGGQKIWKQNPNIGVVKASQAYTSSYFQKNRAYAIRFADRWMILSAKYGFLDPDELINDYDVTFNNKYTCPISIAKLKKQVTDKRLAVYDEAIVLGGIKYLLATKGAFDGTQTKIVSPFCGLSIGARMRAINEALK